MKQYKSIFIFLIGFQILFLFVKQICFQFIEETLYVRSIVAMICMVFGISYLLIYKSKYSISYSLLPDSFSLSYLCFTLLTFVFFFMTLFFIQQFTIQNLIMLVYAGCITPLFEEMLFRGKIWNQLKETIHDERVVFVITTVFFSLWHIGYAIGIYLWQSGNILHCIFMKCLWGFLYGFIFGLIRYKSKNCYLCILLHGILNILG